MENFKSVDRLLTKFQSDLFINICFHTVEIFYALSVFLILIFSDQPLDDRYMDATSPVMQREFAIGPKYVM